MFIAHEIEGQSFRDLSVQAKVCVNTLLARKRYALIYLRSRLRSTTGTRWVCWSCVDSCSAVFAAADRGGRRAQWEKWQAMTAQEREAVSQGWSRCGRWRGRDESA